MARRPKKTYPKLPKQYKAVRVSNPASRWHTSYVSPRQKLKLVLANPCTWWPACSPDSFFKIKLISHFLVMDDVVETNRFGHDVYTIYQKYDLSDWATCGQVLLGNVEIELCNNTHEEGDKHKYHSNICVVQQGNEAILTAVNPEYNTVKMMPGQVLEIVCFERDWNNWRPGKVEADGFKDQWIVKNSSIDERFIFCEKRKSVLGGLLGTSDETDLSIKNKNRYHYKTNRYLPDKFKKGIVTNLLMPIREHHFWYSLTKNSFTRIKNQKDGSYECGSLAFHGSCGEQLFLDETFSAVRKLNIVMGISGKSKKMSPYFLQSVENKLEVMRKSFDKEKKLLVNPSDNESINFTALDNYCDIEIAQPKTFWDNMSESDSWEIVKDTGINVNCLTVEEKEPTVCGGVRFQRIRVTSSFVPSTNQSSLLFVGRFLLVAGVHKKTISGWYANQQINVRKSFDDDDYDGYGSYGAAWRAENNHHGSTYSPPHKKKNIISKVDMEQLNVGLEEGVTRIKISDVFAKKKRKR